MVSDTVPTQQAHVVSVSRDDAHLFSKPAVDGITVVGPEAVRELAPDGP